MSKRLLARLLPLLALGLALCCGYAFAAESEKSDQSKPDDD